MFGAGMVVMTAGSRQAFAMARDGRFPAHGLMRRVNPRTQTPVPATILILVVGVVLMVALPGRSAAAADHRRHDPARAHLRRDRGALPVGAETAGAQGGRIQPRALRTAGRHRARWSGWSLALFVLVTPESSFVPDLVVVGLILVGGIYFAYMMIFNPRGARTPNRGTQRSHDDGGSVGDTLQIEMVAFS